MESMIDKVEANACWNEADVANGVLDGADAEEKRSGETSVGKNPARAIQTIDRIIRRTEQEDEIYHKHQLPNKESKTFLSDAIVSMPVRLLLK